MKTQTQYPLKIESDLWYRFKLKCMTNHKTMLEVITNFIKQYVEEN